MIIVFPQFSTQFPGSGAFHPFLLGSLSLFLSVAGLTVSAGGASPAAAPFSAAPRKNRYGRRNAYQQSKNQNLHLFISL